MKYKLVYFSGTGNTELISRELAVRLEKLGHAVELTSLGPKTDATRLSADADVLGFGFPVYKFTFPDYFKRFFPALNRADTGRTGSCRILSMPPTRALPLTALQTLPASSTPCGTNRWPSTTSSVPRMA